MSSTKDTYNPVKDLALTLKLLDKLLRASALPHLPMLLSLFRSMTPESQEEIIGATSKAIVKLQFCQSYSIKTNSGNLPEPALRHYIHLQILGYKGLWSNRQQNCNSTRV